ncbi:hypothetical protein [Hoyosella altamirensis]|uniref:Uncharacterized protein n=1 Tax=Hoyosella altamirensis TaxID=616997 RepID=A0A839RK21_9ACTN|nr:hypothetical protein [Hoyosella altamirensis]MBB3036524.1 hypothetical protein [Hoyosella altamirensis]
MPPFSVLDFSTLGEDQLGMPREEIFDSIFGIMYALIEMLGLSGGTFLGL